MNLNYSQATGIITDDDGHVIVPMGKAWAGRDKGKNNPDMQGVRETGPLPQGVYTVGDWGTHGHLGPDSAQLIQTKGDTFGRSGFYIHGPAMYGNYGQESKGCIVILRLFRLKVEEMKPDTITVKA